VEGKEERHATQRLVSEIQVMTTDLVSKGDIGKQVYNTCQTVSDDS
jgi:hypothetical protein